MPIAGGKTAVLGTMTFGYVHCFDAAPRVAFLLNADSPLRR